MEHDTTGAAEANSICFETGDGRTRVHARVIGGTMWMTRGQMADLFGCGRSAVSRHVRDFMHETEFEFAAMRVRSAPAPPEGARSESRVADHFPLEVIVAIGARVRSARAAQFRNWVAGGLQGFLAGSRGRGPIRLAGRTTGPDGMVADARTGEAARQGLPERGEPGFGLIGQYSHSWDLFHAFDEDRLFAALPGASQPSGVLDHNHAVRLIAEFKRQLQARGQASAHFGHAHGGALAGALGSIAQTALGEPLYPTREERAAHLLYFLVKDHPFTDGNKRIGSLLFLRYLDQENVKYRIDPDALVSLTLLVANSAPAEKERMVRLIINQIRKSGG